MMYSNVIVGIAISCLCSVSLVLIWVSANLTNVGYLAVGAFDLVNCSLSVVGFVAIFNVGQ